MGHSENDEFRLALEGFLTVHHLHLYKDSIAEKERLIERLDIKKDKASKAYRLTIFDIF